MIRSVDVVDVVKSNKVFGFAHLHLLAKSVSFDNKRTCKYIMTPYTIHTIHKYLLSLHNEHQEAHLQMNSFNRFKFTWGFCVWYQCCTSHLFTDPFFCYFSNFAETLSYFPWVLSFFMRLDFFSNGPRKPASEAQLQTMNFRKWQLHPHKSINISHCINGTSDLQNIGWLKLTVLTFLKRIIIPLPLVVSSFYAFLKLLY